jgi:hypothetical protein
VSWLMRCTQAGGVVRKGGDYSGRQGAGDSSKAVGLCLRK